MKIKTKIYDLKLEKLQNSILEPLNNYLNKFEKFGK